MFTKASSTGRRAALLLVIAVAVAATPAPRPASASGALDGKVLKMVTKLLEDLALTGAERAAIKTVLDAHRTSVDEILARETQAREDLRKAAQRGTYDAADVTNAAKAVAAEEASLALERSQIFAEIAASLTGAQRVRLLRFAVQLERQIAAREKEQVYPATLLVKMKLTDTQLEALAKEETDQAAKAANVTSSVDTARTTLLLSMQQTTADDNMVRRAFERVEAAEVKLALYRAQRFAQLHSVLESKQTDRIRKYYATLDRDIVDRHEAGVLLFLQLLGA